MIKPALLTSAGQYSFAQASTTTPPIAMPSGAIEVKAGWGLISEGACASSTAIHVETFVDPGNKAYCYGLVGIHMSSRLLPNWIWATFEPQSLATNPGRCALPGATGIPAVTTPAGPAKPTSPPASGQFGPCNDAWGSVVAPSSSSAPTAATPALTSLFALQGSSLGQEFQNYRLDGVQTDFGTATAPTLLGNSRIEGEAGVPNGKASCITCHSNAMVSLVNGKAAGNAFTTAMLSGVGPGAVVPAGAYALDFSWMLDFAPAK
ncbi:MAG: hypothetical protein ABJE95_28150 [Byssovorax sp.]